MSPSRPRPTSKWAAASFQLRNPAGIRERETAEAAKVVGADPIGVGFHDSGVYGDGGAIREFTDVTRRV